MTPVQGHDDPPPSVWASRAWPAIQWLGDVGSCRRWAKCRFQRACRRRGTSCEGRLSRGSGAEPSATGRLVAWLRQPPGRARFRRCGTGTGGSAPTTV